MDKSLSCVQVTNLYGGHLLTLLKMDVHVDMVMATCFVTITSTWKNVSQQGTLLFELPMTQHGAVTEVTVRCRDRYFATTVIPTSDVLNLSDQNMGNTPSVTPAVINVSNPSPTTNATNPNPNNNNNSFIPDMFKYRPDRFRLPIQNVEQDEELTITAVYYEPCVYDNEGYFIEIPLIIPDNFHTNSNNLLNITANLTLCIAKTQWTCFTHPLMNKDNNVVQNTMDDKIALITDPSKEMPLKNNLIIGYNCVAEDLQTTIVYDNNSYTSNEDGRTGAFSLFVSPPRKVHKHFQRAIVFLLDHSGSMQGAPFANAVKALIYGIERLQESDMFGVIVFDHEQMCFQNGLVQATVENKNNCKNFLSTIDARGGTDILTPVKMAMQLFRNYPHVVPFIFLVTDGAVADERIICKYLLEQPVRRVRMITFGIGTCCNYYFLKMMALMGQGFSDVAYSAEKIYSQMAKLLDTASTPVLTNVELGLVGLNNVEVYPFPIPDFFVGCPFVVSGRYSGVFPSMVMFKGMMANGVEYKREIRSASRTNMRISSLFVKLRLDILIAKAWFASSDKICKEAIRLSCEENLPCAHTTVVAYEVPMDVGGGGNGGGGDNNDKESARKDAVKRIRSANPKDRKKLIAGIAVGGIVVVGAAAVHFGDLAGTLGNLPLGDLASGLSSIADAGGSIANGLSQAGSAVVDGIGHMDFGAITHVTEGLDGDCCNSCIEAIGHLF